MRFIFSIFLLVSIGTTTSVANEVNIGEPNWSSGKFVANLIKILIEERLGGKANLVPGNNSKIFQGMDSGNGVIDIHPEVWMPNQKNFVDQYVKNKNTVALSTKPYRVQSGICVSKQFADKTKVKSVYDLARSDVAKQLDSDGDGKGEIWVGAPGWAASNINEAKIHGYGLSKVISARRDELPVHLKRISDYISKGQGIAFYCYVPNAIWFMHEIVRLDEPAHDPEKYKMIQPHQDPEWLQKSNVASEDTLKRVQIAYSKSLEKRAPKIAKLVQNIRLNTDIISKWEFNIITNKREPSEVIKEWVQKNKRRVDSWFYGL